MKITNKKYIEGLGAFLMFLIPLNVIVIVIYLLIYQKADWLVFLMLLLLILLIIKVSRLRYTEFENSGLVISLKKKHVLHTKGFVFPVFEFPTVLLQKSELKHNYIYLSITSISKGSNKKNTLKMPLGGFNSEQRSKILMSLTEIISKQ